MKKLTRLLWPVGLVFALYITVRLTQDVVSLTRWAANPLGFSTRTPSGPVVLQQVQKLQRLETCRYNGQVVVQGETSGILPVWLAGDRLLFNGSGEVVAGVDLRKLEAGDLSVRNDVALVRLPPAEIFHTRLDNNQSEVYDRQSGFFSGPDKDLERKVRLQAEDRLRDAALGNDILGTAIQNAQEVVQNYLKQLGFGQIRFL